jgi:hypothetical protein
VAYAPHHTFKSLVSVFLLSIFISPAQAQQGGAEDEEAITKEATPAQSEMNSKAIEKVEKKEFAAAIDLFEASIRLGELNITYLNMGRTYQRMGECVKAKQTYRKARQTRFKVPVPAPDVVDKALNEYESDLYSTCTSGELVLDCDPGKLDLFINTRGPMECPSEEKPLRLEEGEYVISGSYQGYETKQIPIKVNRVERTIAAISLSKKVEQKDPVVVKQPDKDPNANNGNNNGNNGQPINIVINTGEQKEPPKPVPHIGRTIGFMVAGGMLVTYGILHDNCYGNWSRVRNGEPESDLNYCDHTYDGEFSALDLLPLALYVTGGSLMLFPPIKRAVRKSKADQYAPPSKGSQ